MNAIKFNIQSTFKKNSRKKNGCVTPRNEVFSQKCAKSVNHSLRRTLPRIAVDSYIKRDASD